VDGEATDLVTDHLALAGVQPGTDLDPERADSQADGASAAHAARGAVEGGGEDSIPGGVDPTAAEAGKLPPGDGVVAVEHVVPSAVADHGRLLGGADDVGEEHGHAWRHPRRLRRHVLDSPCPVDQYGLDVGATRSSG